MFEALQVAVSASETVSKSMRDISGSASEVAQEFTETAGASLNLAQGMDFSEENVQDMQNTLADIPDDAAISADALGHLENVAEALGDESQELNIDVRLLQSALDSMSNEAIDSNAILSNLQESVQDVSQEMVGANASAHTYAEALDSATRASTQTAFASHRLEAQLEDIRNDAMAAATAMTTFSASTNSIPTDIGFNLGPISGSLKQVMGFIAIILPMLSSLLVVLGGLATVALAAAAGIAAIFTLGIISRAEKMSALSQDIEGTMEGIEQIVSNLYDALMQVTAPLRTIAAENFAFAGLQGFVEWVAIASQYLARMSETLMPLARRLGATFIDATPEFFRELSRLVEELGPMLEGLMTGFIEDMPGLIAFMRKEAAQLLPIIGRFGDAFINLMGPVTEIGTAILSVLLPPLSTLMDFLAGVASVLAVFVVPVFEVIGSIFNWLSATLGPLVEFVGALGAALTLVGLVSYTVANAGAVLLTVWSALSTMAGVLSALLSGPVVSALYSVGAAAWASLGPWGVLLGIIVALLGYFGVLGDIIDGLISGAADIASMIPGIDINASGGGGDDGDDGSDGEGGMGRGGGRTPPTSGGIGGDVNQDYSTNVDIGSIEVEGEGTTEARIRKIIREEVNNQNERSRRRENGRTG